MYRTLHKLRTLFQDERGQGLAEYGLILGLIAVVCVTATETLGTNINSTLDDVGSNLP